MQKYTEIKALIKKHAKNAILDNFSNSSQKS